jgi:glucokinase
MVDAATGTVRVAVNLGVRDLPLRALVEADTGLPTLVDHDVRTAGVAEFTVGLMGEARDCLIAIIGTGIAGVVRSGGQTLAGAIGLAGEIGHMPVWPDGELCPCGQVGCLERYASAASIARHYQALSGRKADARHVARMRDEGDPAATRVWHDAVESLAIAFASCTMLVDPSLIVVGGGLSQAGATLLDPLRTALAARVVWRDCPEVQLSRLGAQAGLLGAAIMAAGLVGVSDFSAWAPFAAPS